MRPIEEMIEIAREHAMPLLEVQSIAEVGLGDTLADILAAGHVRAAVMGDRDAIGRLAFNGADAFMTNGFARWHQGGLPRFRLSHGLAAKLALTDPTGISTDDLKLPFPCFMIELPYPDGPLVVDGDENTTEVLTLLAFWYSNSTRTSQPAEAFESIAELLVECQRVKNETTWDVQQLRALILGNEATYQSWMPIHRALEIRDYSKFSGVPARSCRAAVLAFRIIVNLALYLKHVDSHSLSEGGRTVNHDHGETSLFYEIGEDVKLERPLRDAARAFCMTGKAHEKWKLDKRFIVRGHWKKQACGPDLADRRLIFVEPYWKGPADAPVLARVYTDEPRR